MVTEALRLLSLTEVQIVLLPRCAALRQHLAIVLRLGRCSGGITSVNRASGLILLNNRFGIKMKFVRKFDCQCCSLIKIRIGECLYASSIHL